MHHSNELEGCSVTCGIGFGRMISGTLGRGIRLEALLANLQGMDHMACGLGDDASLEVRVLLIVRQLWG